MKRTKILLTVLLVLVTGIIILFISYKQDVIVEYIVKVVKRASQNNMIIPSETYNKRDYNYLSVHETDNFKPKNLDELKDIYYTFLNNGWGNFSFYCDVDYENCQNDAEMLLDDDEFLSFLNNYVSPYNSYIKFHTNIDSLGEITLKIDRLYTDEEKKQIDEIIDKYISDHNLTSENVTKEDIKSIHDYLIDTITYDEENAEGDEIIISNKANGALINKVALCSGYTDAFAIFMDKLNVPNFNVSTKDHVWNVVYYDGRWRHIDVTWDDDEFNKNNNYNFYMISTDELLEKDKESHDFNQELYLELK